MTELYEPTIEEIDEREEELRKAEIHNMLAVHKMLQEIEELEQERLVH